MTNLFADSNFYFNEPSYISNCFPTLTSQITNFSDTSNVIYNGNGSDPNKPFKNGTKYDNVHFFYTPFRVTSRNYYSEILDTSCWNVGGDLANTSWQTYFKGFDYFMWWPRAHETSGTKYDNDCWKHWHAADTLYTHSSSTYFKGDGKTDTKILRYTFQKLIDWGYSNYTTPSECYYTENKMYSGNIPQLRSSKYFFGQTFTKGNVQYILKNVRIDNLNSSTTQFNNFNAVSTNYLLNYNSSFSPRLNVSWVETEITPSYLLTKQNNDKIQKFNVGNKYIEFVERTKNMFVAVPSNSTNIEKDSGFILKKYVSEPVYEVTDKFTNYLLSQNNSLESYYEVRFSGISGLPKMRYSTNSVSCESGLVNVSSATGTKTTNSVSTSSASANSSIYTEFQKAYQIKNVKLYRGNIPNYYEILKSKINSSNTPMLYKLMNFIDNPKAQNNDKYYGLEDMSQSTINSARNYLIDVFNKVIHKILGNDNNIGLDVNRLFMGTNNYFYDFLINSGYLFYLVGIDNCNFCRVPSGFQFIPNGYSCDGTISPESITASAFVINRRYKNSSQPTGYLPNGNNTISYKSSNSSGFTKKYVSDLSTGTLTHSIKSGDEVATRPSTKTSNNNSNPSYTSTIKIELPLMWLKQNDIIEIQKSYYMTGYNYTVNANPCACNCGSSSVSANSSFTCPNQSAKWNIGTMYACFFPVLYVKNTDILKNVINVKLTNAKNWFNGKYENYKIESFTVNKFQHNLTNGSLTDFNSGSYYVFNNGMSYKTNSLDLIQGVNTLSNYYAMAKEMSRYNNGYDSSYWLTYEAIRLFGIGRLYDPNFSMKAAITNNNSIGFPNGEKDKLKKGSYCANGASNYHHWVTLDTSVSSIGDQIDQRHNCKMRLILPDDRLIPYTYSTVGSAMNAANYKYLDFNKNLAYDKDRNTLILYANCNISYKILTSLSNSTLEGHIQPFTTTKEVWYVTNSCLTDLMSRYSSPLINEFTKELKYLINSNPQVRLTYNFYKLYRDKLFDFVNSANTEFDLYNINFGQFMVSNTTTNALEYKNYYGETTYYQTSGKPLSRYQQYYKYGTSNDETKANFYDYITNIWDNVDIFTIKKSGNYSTAIMVNLPSKPVEFLTFIYQKFISDKYTVKNVPVSSLYSSNVSNWLNADTNMILLSETVLNESSFLYSNLQSMFHNNVRKSDVNFNFPCFIIKYDGSKDSITINLDSKPLYLYYKNNIESFGSGTNYVQLTAIPEETV